ncbi:LysR family transcriptional regulator [Herbaspirillum sp. HC18]|nr:LysR family transcriptional regulator [Herbaspirillum sp. HC18]
MLKLSLDALQIIDAIDRRGSFAGAAKEMFRVPSTISYTVGKLEEDLGVQLFERAGPKIELTAAGQELLREGRYLLKAAGDLECRVRRVSSGWETEFVIGMDSMFSPLGLSEHIMEFYACADQTRLRIVQESLSGTWEALLDGRVDLLIGAAGEGPSGGGYAALPLGQIPFVFTVSPTHPLARLSRPLTKDDLQEYRAISVADSARRLPTRTVGLLFGQDVLTVPDMRTKYEFQAASVGFGFLPEPWARYGIESGQLVEMEVEEARPAETFYLAWRSTDDGQALKWWTDRMQKNPSLLRLLKTPLRP